MISNMNPKLLKNVLYPLYCKKSGESKVYIILTYHIVILNISVICFYLLPVAILCSIQSVQLQVLGTNCISPHCIAQPALYFFMFCNSRPFFCSSFHRPPPCVWRILNNCTNLDRTCILPVSHHAARVNFEIDFTPRCIYLASCI